ncbi:unnamed protein product [Cyprideis torosa]|uniref:Uncharacterized protein n=1 Tax=Cyprideis torosa TaxID=163714 RepID=A0A7R8ZQD8_9CRUS|nr:unnamed protein product [Cyprideis torosa]CAG0891838.1 unnamed protein product [Cyprideis torosa]
MDKNPEERMDEDEVKSPHADEDKICFAESLSVPQGNNEQTSCWKSPVERFRREGDGPDSDETTDKADEATSEEEKPVEKSSIPKIIRVFQMPICCRCRCRHPDLGHGVTSDTTESNDTSESDSVEQCPLKPLHVIETLNAAEKAAPLVEVDEKVSPGMVGCPIPSMRKAIPPAIRHGAECPLAPEKDLDKVSERVEGYPPGMSAAGGDVHVLNFCKNFSIVDDNHTFGMEDLFSGSSKKVRHQGSLGPQKSTQSQVIPLERAVPGLDLHVGDEESVMKAAVRIEAGVFEEPKSKSEKFPMDCEKGDVAQEGHRKAKEITKPKTGAYRRGRSTSGASVEVSGSGNFFEEENSIFEVVKSNLKAVYGQHRSKSQNNKNRTLRKRDIRISITETFGSEEEG